MSKLRANGLVGLMSLRRESSKEKKKKNKKQTINTWKKVFFFQLFRNKKSVFPLSNWQRLKTQYMLVRYGEIYILMLCCKSMNWKKLFDEQFVILDQTP